MNEVEFMILERMEKEIREYIYEGKELSFTLVRTLLKTRNEDKNNDLTSSMNKYIKSQLLLIQDALVDMYKGVLQKVNKRGAAASGT